MSTSSTAFGIGRGTSCATPLGGWHVRTTGPQGSGILSSMVAGNCLIVLEEDRGDVAAGERVLVEPF